MELIILKDIMKNSNLDLYENLYKVFQIHRRIGFGKGELLYYRLSLKDKPPTIHFTFSNDYTDESIHLYSIKENECQNIYPYGIAMNLAEKIKDKTGLDIEVVGEIDVCPKENSKFEEKMWHARLVLQGIDDDY